MHGKRVKEGEEKMRGIEKERDRENVENLQKLNGPSNYCLVAVIGVVWSLLALIGSSSQTYSLLPFHFPKTLRSNTFL